MAAGAGDDSTSSSLGLVAEYDTTDNFFWPGQGVALSGEYQFYGHFLGDYRYDLLTLDGKVFLPLNPTDAVPRRELPDALAGGSTPAADGPALYQAAGISSYRYQGEDVSTVQAQLGWQVTPRWVVQGFVGAGSAEDSASDLYTSAEVAWGTGFRYLIAREYGLHTGVDVAFSDHEQAVYFNVGSGL